MSYPRPSRTRIKPKPKPRRPKRNWGRIIGLSLAIAGIGFFALLVASPFLYRSYRISKVPDAPVPIDTPAPCTPPSGASAGTTSTIPVTPTGETTPP